MKSFRNPDFHKLYKYLSKEVKESARKTYKIWKLNPLHPSLHFKKIFENPPIYSVRVGRNWRALAVKGNDAYIWFWIGSHEEYNKLIHQIG